MNNAGFKALARRLCVGHAFSCPVRWGGAVEVCGRVVQPGQLIHADKHGFLAVPPEDEARLLDAAQFMDANECQTLIPAARDSSGRTVEESCAAIDDVSSRPSRWYGPSSSALVITSDALTKQTTNNHTFKRTLTTDFCLQ
jgi:hypothetical protein